MQASVCVCGDMLKGNLLRNMCGGSITLEADIAFIITPVLDMTPFVCARGPVVAVYVIRPGLGNHTGLYPDLYLSLLIMAGNKAINCGNLELRLLVCNG